MYFIKVLSFYEIACIIVNWYYHYEIFETSITRGFNTSTYEVREVAGVCRPGKGRDNQKKSIQDVRMNERLLISIFEKLLTIFSLYIYLSIALSLIL